MASAPFSACSEDAQGQASVNFALADSFSELSINRIATHVATNPMIGPPNELQVISLNDGKSAIWNYPDTGYLLQGVRFSDADDSKILFVAHPVKMGTDLLCVLDIRNGFVRTLRANHSRIKAPRILSDGTIIYFGAERDATSYRFYACDDHAEHCRMIGESHLQDVSDVDEVDGSYYSNGVVGQDGFDSLRHDQEYGFPRAHLVYGVANRAYQTILRSRDEYDTMILQGSFANGDMMVIEQLKNNSRRRLSIVSSAIVPIENRLMFSPARGAISNISQEIACSYFREALSFDESKMILCRGIHYNVSELYVESSRGEMGS